jgi:hypothetical protein
VELDVADVDDHSSFDEPSSRSDEEMPSGPSLADRLRRRLGRPPKPRAWKNTQERFTGSTEVTPAPASIEDSGERRSLAPASRLGGAMNRRLARPVQRPLPTESPAGGEAATPRASNRRRARFGTSAIKRQTRFNPVEPEQRKVGLRSIGRQEEGFEVHLGGAASSDEGATQQRDLPNDDLATIQKAAQELGSFLEASPDEATIQKSPRELSRGVAQDAEPRDPPGRSSPTIPIRLDPPEEP